MHRHQEAQEFLDRLSRPPQNRAQQRSYWRTAYEPRRAVVVISGLDIGCDIGSLIDFTYEMPFVFTGKIEKITIALKPEASSKKSAT